MLTNDLFIVNELEMRILLVKLSRLMKSDQSGGRVSKSDNILPCLDYNTRRLF